MRLRVWMIAFAACCVSSPARAQEPAAAPRSTGAISMFLDCRAMCDEDYMHTEITYVDWVRDRTVADVHALISTLSTGAGGTQYTITFIGLRRFAPLADTLVFASAPAATENEVRRAMTRTLKAGLVRFIARTPMADRLEISLANGEGQPTQTTPRVDPWHAWVFTTSINGNHSAEESNRSTSLSGRVTASRTTEDWKLNVGFNENYNESRFTIPDPDTTIVNIQRGFGVDGLAVKSLGAHWSAGLKGTFSASTFLNQRRYLRITPAAEYDVYPYAESTRRQLRVQYAIGYDAVSYADTTVFLKTSERLPVHTLSIAYARQEEWGSVIVGANGSSYLRDPSKHSGSVEGGLSLRVIRGLNLNLNGGYSSIHDQIYLAKGEATQAEVLLRQRQLLTGYRWTAFVGLSYTFGSLFNNVVNPRFGDSGGMMFFMF